MTCFLPLVRSLPCSAPLCPFPSLCYDCPPLPSVPARAQLLSVPPIQTPPAFPAQHLHAKPSRAFGSTDKAPPKPAQDLDQLSGQVSRLQASSAVSAESLEPRMRAAESAMEHLIVDHRSAHENLTGLKQRVSVLESKVGARSAPGGLAPGLLR